VTVFSEGPLRSALRAATDGRVEIDAESGRNVLLLDDLVHQQLVRAHRPRTLVLALGTNPDPSWTRSDFRRVLDTIPDSVSVVLVTVYREPGTAPTWVLRALADYSRWMQELAASRQHVCLAPWRARVDHRAGRLTLDGVHPNNRGAEVFARVVADAVQRCVTG
jgi:lysophospholipase L1-like esterase